MQHVPPRVAVPTALRAGQRLPPDTAATVRELTQYGALIRVPLLYSRSQWTQRLRAFLADAVHRVASLRGHGNNNDPDYNSNDNKDVVLKDEQWPHVARIVRRSELSCRREWARMCARRRGDVFPAVLDPHVVHRVAARHQFRSWRTIATELSQQLGFVVFPQDCFRSWRRSRFGSSVNDSVDTMDITALPIDESIHGVGIINDSNSSTNDDDNNDNEDNDNDDDDNDANDSIRGSEVVDGDEGGNVNSIDDSTPRVRRRQGITAIRWTPEEDARLVAAVEALGRGSWTKVAVRVRTRTGKQCLHRFRQQFAATTTLGEATNGAAMVGAERTVRGRWRAEEDAALREAVAQVAGADAAAGEIRVAGGQWPAVARRVARRSAAQCRERWLRLAGR